MITIKQFNNYVEIAYKRNDYSGLDYIEIGKIFDYDFAHNLYISHRVYDFICSKISDELSDNTVNLNKISLMKKHLLIEYFLTKSELSKKSFLIIQIIFDATKNIIGLSSELSKWINAIDFSLACVALSQDDPLSYIEHCCDKEKSIAKSLKYMWDKGYKIDLIDGNITIEEYEHKRICQSIDIRMSKFGDLTFKNILNGLEIENRRYKFKRISKNPLLPVGYIFNLSLKHLDKIKIEKIGAKKRWDDLILLAIHYCTLLEVQEYSNIEIAFEKPATISNTLQRMVLNDQIYAINQILSEDIYDVISELFRPLSNRVIALPWSIQDYLDVTRVIINIASVSVPCKFSADQLCNKLQNKISREKILKILCDMSQEKNSINKNYLTPFDTKELNYYYYPLIKISETEFGFLNLSFFSYGFYEVISSKLRKSGIKDDEVGILLEKYIEKKLLDSGINYLAGKKYKITNSQRKDLSTDREDGECDFIVETSDTIMFIEVKKKILTRNAQSGDVFSIITDLTKSFIAAQVQGNWHELIIKKYGSIKFESGEELFLKKRSIEKISLSMFNFMSLHDNTLIHYVLRNLIGKEIGYDDSKYKKTLKEVNEYLKDISKQYNTNEFLKYKERGGNFFNCSFFNLFIFLDIIKHSKSAEDFKSQIDITRRVTTGEKDWFAEQSYIKSILAHKTT